MIVPFIPEKNTRKVIVDKNLSGSSKKIIESFGIDLIESIENINISNSTSTHPDMQFCPLGNNKAIVASFAFDYYSNMLPDFELLKIDDIHFPYPYDSKINITIINDYCLCTDFQWEIVKNSIDKVHIKINQGYSKCNLCILNNNAVLTSDIGMINSLKDTELRTYYLPNDQIYLEGYQCGFWGGCSGLLSDNTIFFNGDITKLSCCEKLLTILEKEKIEPIFNKVHALCDCGSIIPII